MLTNTCSDWEECDDKYSDYEYKSTEEDEYENESFDDNDSLLEKINEIRINSKEKKCFYKELNIFLELFPKSKLCHEYEENDFKVKIRLTYDHEEYYLFMEKWDCFLKLYEKINDTFEVAYHEIVLDKINFFIDIDINYYKKSHITKKVLKEYFKNKLNLEIKEINIDIYKLNNISRFIINSYCFLINDHKYIYNNIKEILESSNIKVIETDYKYIPIEYFNDEKIFLTNIYNSFYYNLITNNSNMDIVFENNDNFILSDECQYLLQYYLKIIL